MTGRVSRRRFLGGVGAAGAGAALATTGLAACGDSGDGDQAAKVTSAADTVIAFRGGHQAGITTATQDRLVFSALDVQSDDPADLAALLDTWTVMAESMTNGDLVPGNQGDLLGSPADTGEAYGLPASRLTITIGFGPSLFDERFGLAGKKPKLLEQLPPLPNELLLPEISDGDICIQACADDPLVAYHAVRDMVRAGIGTTTHKWMQFGFGRTSSTSTSQATARNLLGFKDGTNNLKSEERKEVDTFVWVDDDADPAWMRGGSFLVARKIAMFIENWDHDSLGDQQNVIGRVKDTGAPLGEASEFAPLDLKKKDSDGNLVLPEDSHVRLASPEANGGIKLLRRGYNYTDGVDQTSGNLQAGLFFLAYMNDPAHFIKVQRNLAKDGLNEYIKHVASGIYACPGGLAKGESWKDKLF